MYLELCLFSGIPEGFSSLRRILDEAREDLSDLPSQNLGQQNTFNHERKYNKHVK